MCQLILASKSPRRSEILVNLGIHFHVLVNEVAENQNPFENPIYLAEENARRKVERFQGMLTGESLVIGADTIVVKDIILGKPADGQAAFKMLSSLSGRAHQVVTGLALLHYPTGRVVSSTVSTQVFFKPLTSEEISLYIQTGEPMDKAGAYGIQGIGALFVEKIIGDYYNVVGLPVFELESLLKHHFHKSLLTDFK